MHPSDTIVALSSGSLPAGVAIVRLSGPAAADAVRWLAGDLPQPRRLTLRKLAVDGETIDQGLVAWFPGPQSFTGEDCAELQVHGSPATVRALLRALTARAGMRLAEAGEFTRRAFENGKLDLTEVEGLGDLIEAETENQRKQALARLGGGLSHRLDAWRERLLDLRAEIEAQLDFSDEGDVGTLPSSFLPALAVLEQEFRDAADSMGRGRIVREGLRVALAGPPNAGKSSLLNALARSEVAIVTDEPGTTRDVREVPIDLGGNLVVLLDMAGLRETASKAEAEGVRRARDQIARADLVLWLIAPDVEPLPPESSDAPIWIVGTKADVGLSDGARYQVSVVSGLGVAELLGGLREFAAMAGGAGEGLLVSRERDRVALDAAATALSLARTELARPELLAESLREASHALERLLGRLDPEKVLDRLFLAFCIGK